MSAPFRGIFPVLLTPLNVDDEPDIASMKKQVSFCIEAGAHGLVFPVLGSEFQFLTEAERKRMVEVIVGEAGGQIPVVAGVAGSNKAEAVLHAQHAAKTQADAVIALDTIMASPNVSIGNVATHTRQIRTTRSGISFICVGKCVRGGPYPLPRKLDMSDSCTQYYNP